MKESKWNFSEGIGSSTGLGMGGLIEVDGQMRRTGWRGTGGTGRDGTCRTCGTYKRRREALRMRLHAWPMSEDVEGRVGDLEGGEVDAIAFR